MNRSMVVLNNPFVGRNGSTLAVVDLFAGAGGISEGFRRSLSLINI